MGSRLTIKGQVTIPKTVRDALGLRPGDEVDFVADAGGYRLRKLVRSNPFTKYRGYLAGHEDRDADAVVQELRGDGHRR